MPTTLVVHVDACEICPFYLRRGHERRWCLHPAWARPEFAPAHDTTIRGGGARLERRHLPIPRWCPLADEQVTVLRSGLVGDP